MICIERERERRRGRERETEDRSKVIDEGYYAAGSSLSIANVKAHVDNKLNVQLRTQHHYRRRRLKALQCPPWVGFDQGSLRKTTHVLSAVFF